MHRPPSRRRTGIALPALTALLCAAVLLTGSRMGGDAHLRALLERVAATEWISRAVFAMEAGVLPAGGQTLHTPHAVQTGAQTAAAATSSDTETVSESALPPAAPAAQPEPRETVRAETVEVRNDAGLSVDPAAMLADPYEIKVSGDGPQVLIYHTHSTEAYTPTDSNPYEPSGEYRTLDPNQNVIRVGTELTQVLEARGIGVVHLTEVFDNPAYNGSYGRSLAAAQEALEENPSIQVVIDLHRDAVVQSDGSQLRLATTLDGQDAAQLMLVVGTNASGLAHDGWRDNMNFAVNLQADLDGTWEGLMRPVNLRAQRFNAHLRPGALLLEVGASGNTLEEALVSIRLFGEALADRIL